MSNLVRLLLKKSAPLTLPLVLGGVLFSGTKADAQSVTLTWDPSPTSTVVGYRLHYGTTSGDYPNKVTLSKNTLHTLNGLTAGTRYFFVVTAFTDSGLESDFSNRVDYTIPVGLWNPVRNPRKVSASDMPKGAYYLMAKHTPPKEKKPRYDGALNLALAANTMTISPYREPYVAPVRHPTKRFAHN